jgi:hypothetical protein
MLHISCQSDPPTFGPLSNMQRTALIMKIPITLLCNPLLTFTPVWPNNFLSTLFRGTLTLMLCTVWQTKFYTNTYWHYVTNTATKLWGPQNSHLFFFALCATISFPQTASQTALLGYIYGDDNKKSQGSSSPHQPSLTAPAGTQLEWWYSTRTLVWLIWHRGNTTVSIPTIHGTSFHVHSH